MSTGEKFLRSVRVPALRPATIQPAIVRTNDPSDILHSYFVSIATTRMSGLPFLNPCLEVEIHNCRRVKDDWLATVITPWSIFLVLLPGGGTLWQNAGLGERVRCELPAGALDFIADVGEGGLGTFLYCPLISPATEIKSQVSARVIASEAIQTCLSTLSVPIEPAPEAENDSMQTTLTRRGFLLGRRQ